MNLPARPVLRGVYVTLATVGLSAALQGCGSSDHTGAQPDEPTPATWDELRSTYRPLLTTNGLSKGCNFAPDQASCFAGLHTAATELATEVARIPTSASTADVQNQIRIYDAKYQEYLAGQMPDRFSLIGLDVGALGIWRALLQAQ